jgi:protein-disulfide isomerase
MDVRWRMISLALAGAGWILSALLLFWGVAPRGAPQLHLPDGFCPGCTSALAAPGGWQLGFPLAAWALVYFAVSGFLIAHAGRHACAAAWAMSGAATGASAVLTVSLYLNGVSDCLPCLAVHVINAALFSALFSALSAATARQRSPAAAAMPRWRPIHRRLSLAAVFILAGGAAETAMRPPWRAEPHTVRAYWTATPRPIPAGPDDPSRGAADSPVVLVVFSSFQCPGCQEFAHVLRHLDQRFAGRLTTVFKHFPLGKICNTALTIDLQPRSCAAAEAAEAAHRLHAFWRFHDNLFRGSLGASEDELQRIAADSGVALEQWKIERSRPAVREKIRKDVELAWRLGVDATPAVFLNGRRVSDLRLSQLETLIRAELAMRGSAQR